MKATYLNKFKSDKELTQFADWYTQQIHQYLFKNTRETKPTLKEYFAKKNKK